MPQGERVLVCCGIKHFQPSGRAGKPLCIQSNHLVISLWSCWIWLHITKTSFVCHKVLTYVTNAVRQDVIIWKVKSWTSDCSDRWSLFPTFWILEFTTMSTLSSACSILFATSATAPGPGCSKAALLWSESDQSNIPSMLGLCPSWKYTCRNKWNSVGWK